jgi:inositol transport system permease protein
MGQKPMLTITETTEQSTNRFRRIEWITILEKFGVVLFLLLLVVFFQLQNERFLSIRNILNILSDVSIYGILSVGMTFVILTSGIDLSIGSLLAFASMCGAVTVKSWPTISATGLTWLIAPIIALTIGAAAGYLHGKAITKLRVPAFIVTLGGMTLWRGATLMLSNGSPISGFDTSYRWWGRGDILGFPFLVLISAVVAGIGFVVLRYTRFGRHVYAVGDNPEAARLSGLNVDGVLIRVYAIMGCLAGLAGFILSARLSSAEAVAGEGYELRVIASVVIGGTSLFGGLGGIAGTIVGTLLIGVLLNGLVIINVSAYSQQVIIGIIIVLAVAFDTFTKTRRGRAIGK